MRLRDDAMKTKIVSYTPQTLPPLTNANRAKLKALAARPGSESDTSDCPGFHKGLCLCFGL